ncbi:hypothetical protein LQV63_28775 [Paenibacillus profundus]|uniref:Uncharacterized protein n=1 Tax=Paenibacillus profundus TaxID=1173085 RepID=A0ABS8YUF9_9BACL|nr:hypothetical protein [Paenibacillus profundus]MCE5173259.1 hypothetical protein [Paenibacillus profundus]
MSNQEPYAEASDAAYTPIDPRPPEKCEHYPPFNSGAWFVLNQARYHKDL